MNVSNEVESQDMVDEILFQTINAVSEAENCDPLELPPLYEVIDPEVFGKAVGADRPTKLSFSYLEYQVTVTGNGQVQIKQQ